MTGLFASLSVRKALDKLASFLPASLASPWVPSSSSATPTASKDLEDLRRLERTMHRIHATLHDAEEHWNIREESAKLRLKELKDLAYDAEDVVEEYEYECKVEALERSTRINHKRRREKGKEAYSIDPATVSVPKELAVQARKIIERFDEIKNYSDNFTLSENDGEKRFAPDISSIRKTSSVVFEKSILGRAQDKNEVVKKLFSREGDSTTSPVSVLAIVGMGGLGKTTLAQLVYNDPRMHQSFDKLAWVCVSEQFDISSITRNIISSVTKKGCDLSELGNLQERLVDEVKEKRVLLVLDDVWNERSDCWDSLCMPMMTTSLCKIVVTTRNEAVARLVQTMPLHRLNCLSFDEGWSLFKQVAFSVHQENDTPANLIEIGKSIVKKCKGLPLAIKTLGSMLRYETDERRWRHVLESELVDLEKPRDEVLPALELSYRHMPIYLKRCFVSLSLYPKDYDLKEYLVVRMWKLLDLLECDGNDNKDEIGSLYFNELVERSFIQSNYLQGNYFGKENVMHDLLHDLACFLAAEEFFRLEDTSVEIPQNARYLSIKNGASGVISVASNSLRAIIVLVDAKLLSYAEVNIKNPEALFLNSEKLRVLVFDDRCLGKALPDFMGSLKLLRHLSRSAELSGSNVDLRGIGRLINLHSLPEIGSCHRNFRELRSLKEIREVSIYDLDSVARIEDVNEAQLHSKRHLRSLELHFCGYGQDHKKISAPVSQEQVFESLRPHHSLRKLTIHLYECQKYPCWFGNPSFSNLTEICLIDCNHLPTLGELPSLKRLSVQHLPYVRHIGREFCSHVPGIKGFPSLTRLSLFRMEVCSEWSGVDIGEFPCLETLWISCADELRSLPSVPFLTLITLDLLFCKKLATIPAWPTLRKLRSFRCDGLNELPTLLSLRELDITGCPKLSAVRSLPALTTLKLEECPTLSSVGSHPSLTTLELSECPKLSAVRSLPSLTTLRLRNCQNLSAVGSLPSMTTLEVIMCPKLSAVRSLPSLTTLELQECPNLNSVRSLPALTTLKLWECPNLISVGSHPSLTTLRLWNCQNLSAVGFLPSLTTLELRMCPKLSAVGSVPLLTSLKLWECPNLESLIHS